MSDSRVATLRQGPDAEVRPFPKVARHRRLLRPLLLAAGPLVVVVAGLAAYVSGGGTVTTDNAYTHADKLALAAEVAGTVTEVAVTENQRVEAGQVLFRLDDEPYRLALAAAEAQLAAVRDELAALQAGYRDKLVGIRQAEIDIAFFENENRRQGELAQHHATPETRQEEARHNLDNSRQRLLSLRQQAQVIQAQLGGDVDRPPASQARVQYAQAQVDKARRDLRHTVVTAPRSGIVANVDSVQVGQYLLAAQPAFSLVATDHPWIQANPKETDLTHVAPGNPVTFTVDAYPGTVWHGTVASIGPATGAEFSLLPAQNTSGNWVKVVQRVPLRLAVEVPPGAPQLRSGMSADIAIDTGFRRSWAGLLAEMRGWVGL